MKRLASALEAARLARGRIAKEQAIGDALARVAREDPDERTLATAARIAAGRALPAWGGKKLGVGWRLVYDVATELVGDAGGDVGAMTQEAGDLGEALAALLERSPAAAARPGVTLAHVGLSFERLADAASREDKRALVAELLSAATPLEAKYLAKALLGELRIGAQEGVILGAIARGFGRAPAEVRAAAALVTDPGELAVLAAKGWLSDARLHIGRPVAFMLATPIETLASPIEWAAFVVEDKIDGVRAQLHKSGADVRVFARGLDDVTAAFPEIVRALSGAAGDFALDGELVAIGEGGRPRPFQQLQNRLGRKAPPEELVRATPVAFVAYDLLADGAGDVLARPWEERRARLEALASRVTGPAFMLNPASAAPVDGDLDARFLAARARGHEGLVLKRRDAPYEPGRRGQAWLKVKRAFATLDVVITAAELGHGKRAGVLSDYTFAVWRGEGADASLVDVGKAYSGLTDAEIAEMTARLEASTLRTLRRGGLRVVRPEIVLEVAFDGIQRSKRHPSGFALRFPRIARIRDDKPAEAADRLEAVEALFASQVASGHREEAPAAAPRVKAESRQLSLFGDPRAPPPRTKS